MSKPRSCHLLLVVGLRPQVITETIWRLAEDRSEPLHATSITVVTTGAGEDHLRAGLFGEQRYFNARLIPNCEKRWPAFQQAVRKRFGFEPPEPRVVVVGRNGRPLDDIRSPEDAEAAAVDLYNEVWAATLPDDQLVVGSIAGGRKTMSADLQTALSVLGRPNHRLVHVLVPADIEKDHTIYYPSPDHPFSIDLVDVHYPRLRPLLADGPLKTVLKDGNLKNLFAILGPYNYATTPTHATLELGEGRANSYLRLYGPLGELGQVALQAAEAATLVTLAEQIARTGGNAKNLELAENEEVDEQRVAVYVLCGRSLYRRHRSSTKAESTRQKRALTVWDSTIAVSQSINRLNKALSRLPMARDFVEIRGKRPATDVKSDDENAKTETIYHYSWASKTPLELTVKAPSYTPSLLAKYAWPFNHVAIEAGLPEPAQT